ncbi:hypothetical protein [Bacillus testis]|uniref:hypothetical protein n=1 Tax=Bacillus testis TaxID=1622072 RepID=UPI00067E8136|nr:hypothetical protein [Bacillus testis]
MESIVPIKGKVRFAITLDPSVWIFDDRKKKMDDFFKEDAKADDEMETYTKEVSKHWDKEMTEGAQLPETQKKPKRKYNKQEMRTESYGIYFHDFLKNSEPESDAVEVIVECENSEHRFSMEQAEKLILCFSDKGKALKEDGPVHIYYGSTPEEKITHVRAFRVQ